MSLPFIKEYHNAFKLVATAVFLVQPLDLNSKGWIISIEEWKPCKFRILYPLCRDPVEYKDDSGFPKFLNIDEFRVSQIGKGYLLRVSSLYQDEVPYPARKVVLCLNYAESVPYSTADDCIAVVLYTDGTLIGMRLRDGNWGYVHGRLSLRFADILWLGGRVVAVVDGGKLFVINHMTLKVSKVIVKRSIRKDLGSIRLVSSSDGLYLVALYWKKIYKLNWMQCKWEEITSLGTGFCIWLLLKQGGDFVIFNRSVFNGSDSNHLGYIEAVKDLGILMYCFRIPREAQMDLSYQAVSGLLWLLPMWFWQDAFPSNK